jgi:hypothetical protein
MHPDLPGDGKRTDCESNPGSGIKLRDFLFIQLPGKDWPQVNATTGLRLALYRGQEKNATWNKGMDGHGHSG